MADLIKEVSGKEWGQIRGVISDHDAEGNEVLRQKGFNTINANKDIDMGIQQVYELIAQDPPGIVFHRDALVSRDYAIQSANLPTCTEEEIQQYVWGRYGKPVKQSDHGMDAMRYFVATLNKAINSQKIRYESLKKSERRMDW